MCLAGCTPWSQYVRNGFKVGPNYGQPPAAVAPQWIDAADARVCSTPTDDSRWWLAFNDPTLTGLIQTAYQQNLSLREAGLRVLEARAQLGIAVGEAYPQLQTSSGNFQRKVVSRNVANREATPKRWFSQWDYGFSLSWELDFWGRFRRAIESSEAALDASVEQYDQVLVTLLGDVATYYVQYRTAEQRIAYAQQNAVIQKKSLDCAVARFQGRMASEVDVNHAESDLAYTEALIRQLQIPKREAANRLCILLGMPPEDLQPRLGHGPIPTARPEVVVGIPADLLRRRPDVRRAERQAAAQCAQIGVAEADYYPQFTLNGMLGWGSEDFSNLFAPKSLQGSVGPGFQWKILNYGRIRNNVLMQDARFQELIVAYQQTVLSANEEVENGLVRFLQSQEEVIFLGKSVNATQKAVDEALAQYAGGMADYIRVAVPEEQLVQRQDELAQAQGTISLGLIQVYRALGGGWQMRLSGPPTP